MFMKLIQINRRNIKALSVVFIIAAGLLYNGHYGLRVFGIRVTAPQENTINIASDESDNSVSRMAEVTKTVFISGIKQLTSNH